MIRVKICGITNLDDALTVESLGADALDFIFTKKSPRCIRIAQAKKIISSLGPFVAKVGVFMDQKKEEVLDIACYLGLDVLQFHGRESFAYCKSFQPQFKVIKVCFPDDLPKVVLQYQKLDALMFDIPYQQKKQAKTLSAKSLKFIKAKIKENKKVILSGALNCGNIKSIVKIKPYGIDACRGTEKLVGKKDKGLVKDLIRKAKNVSS